MTKKIQTILIIFFSIFLVSCGYKKVFQSNVPIIYIKNFDYTGDNKLGYLIKNEVLLASQKNANNILEIILDLEKNKLIKTKNKSGKAERYTIQLDANVSIKNLNNMKIIDKSFNQTIDYNVQNNHFDTINEENSVKTIAAEKIAEDIVKYLMLSYNN